MIYRLFRKEFSLRSALDINKSQRSQSMFIEQISRMIKALKRQQKFYSDLEQKYASLPNNNDDMQALIRQYQSISQQTKQIMQALLCFHNESYFTCKAYLYTAYMRVTEMIEKHRGKSRSEGKSEVERKYEEFKKIFTETYNRQIYQEKYDIPELFEVVIKDQSSRINQFFPKKRVIPLSPINNSKKILDQLKQNSQSCSDLRRKCVSIELPKPVDVKLQQIINKKLLVPQLATLKRVQERKKEKVKPKVVNLFKLYDVLDIRPPVIEKSYIFRDEFEFNMSQRNQPIRQEMKKWEKRCLAAKFNKKQRK